MTVLLSIDRARGPVLSGEAEVVAARAAPVADPSAGQGDVRKGIKPNRAEASEPSVQTWEHGALIRLEDWLANADAHRASGAPLGLVLMPAEDARRLAGRLDGLAMIALDFPKAVDGRGYSHAVRLRTQLGFAGELRAVGEVRRDQIFYMARCGITSFALAAGEDGEGAVRALADFPEVYQTAADGRGPVFRARGGDPLEAKAEAAIALMAQAAREAGGPIALASSLSAEDMVLTDLIVRARLPIGVFTLDTGRLHEETVEMIAKTEARYGIAVEVYRPDEATVATYVRNHGANAFYDSVELRKACCGMRKVEPLNRALAGKAGWITGQRREQAITRSDLPEREQDAERGMIKLNPLADWSWEEILAYAQKHDVPLNPLHARGYPSIGCDPCTRAIRPGEDPRAGRWWWEQADQKECGLHVTPLQPAAA